MSNVRFVDIDIPETTLFGVYPFIAQALMSGGKGDFIEAIYQREKIDCILRAEEYQKAQNKYSLLENGTLKREIELKHCLGVLLLNNSDVNVKKRFLSGAKIRYQQAYDFTKKKSAKLMDYIKKGTYPEKIDDRLLLSVYFLWLQNGKNFSAPESYNIILRAFIEQALELERYQEDNIQQNYKKISESDEVHSLFSKFEAIQNPSDIRRHKDIYDGLAKSHASNLEPQIMQALNDVYTIVAGTLDTQMLSSTLILEPQSIFKEERKQICGLINYPGLRNQETNCEMDREAYLYITGLYITAFCKEYKNAKRFLRSDHVEIAEELEVASRKIEKMQLENNAMQQRILALEEKLLGRQGEVERCRRRTAAEFYDQVAALKEENEELNSANQSLAAEHYDYARLKELAYLLESESDDSEKQVDITPILSKNKVFVIGGHESWQKRVKKAIPGINLLSGTLHSVNLEVLKNADFVLIFTGHMAHTVYDKLYKYLYKHSIPYDYLPCQSIEGVKRHIAKVISN